MSNYLVEGISGAGKTTVAEELQRRGYHVVHGDRELAYHGDPETGEPDDGPVADSGLLEIASRHERWIWNLEKVRTLVSDHTHAATFFCGGSRNGRRYFHLFDKVLVLVADLETLQGRVSGRGEDEFGARPDEWAMLVRLHAADSDLPENTLSIDATQPILLVVDEILKYCAVRSKT